MVKILALHGFAQHPDELSCKMRQIQTILHPAEFVFPPAAIELVSYDGDITDRDRDTKGFSTRYSWNHSSEDMSTNLFNLEATLASLVPILESQGPFDGVMGFSQGAAVATAVCSLLEKQTFKINHPPMKFSILFCGARPEASVFDLIYAKIKTPSLHVIGRQDVMVPLERSIQLSEAFEQSELIFHPGNHFIPQGASYTKSVVNFVTRCLQDRTAEDLPEVGRSSMSLHVDERTRSPPSISPSQQASRLRLIHRVTKHTVQLRTC